VSLDHKTPMRLTSAAPMANAPAAQRAQETSSQRGAQGTESHAMTAPAAASGRRRKTSHTGLSGQKFTSRHPESSAGSQFLSDLAIMLLLARKSVWLPAHQGRAFEETSLSTPTHCGRQSIYGCWQGTPKAGEQAGLSYLIVASRPERCGRKRGSQAISQSLHVGRDRPSATKTGTSNLIAQQVSECRFDPP
jgi:hypothetical protein